MVETADANCRHQTCDSSVVQIEMEIAVALWCLGLIAALNQTFNSSVVEIADQCRLQISVDCRSVQTADQCRL